MKEAIVSKNDLAECIESLILSCKKEKARMLVAVDGRCASGKTTLAEELKIRLDCDVVHMDHFFLRPELRSAERLAVPGENIDHERFLTEVLLPLYRGECVQYRPFDCQKQDFAEPVRVGGKGICIIEGAYSCHERLREYYDLRIFISVEPKEQMRRIVDRNGMDGAEMFRKRWIPLEEQYFETCRIADVCDYCFTT
ncbi:MAG: uridine kinase [Lachnospiraceae bacterium]|nr:uridine kinase [Lachnospiraceae bacterium]